MTERLMAAEQLREIRFMADLSMEEFAERVGVSLQELEDMESGRMPIPVRFKSDAFVVADNAIREMGWP